MTWSSPVAGSSSGTSGSVCYACWKSAPRPSAHISDQCGHLFGWTRIADGRLVPWHARYVSRDRICGPHRPLGSRPRIQDRRSADLDRVRRAAGRACSSDLRPAQRGFVCGPAAFWDVGRGQPATHHPAEGWMARFPHALDPPRRVVIDPLGTSFTGEGIDVALTFPGDIRSCRAVYRWRIGPQRMVPSSRSTSAGPSARRTLCPSLRTTLPSLYRTKA